MIGGAGNDRMFGGEGADLLKPYARALADWHFENAAFSCSG